MNSSKQYKQYHKNGSLKSEYWMENGGWHRIGEPAIIHYYENGNIDSEAWWMNGKSHRIGGPSYQDWNETGNLTWEEWFENGTHLTDKEIIVIKRKLKLCQIQ